MGIGGIANRGFSGQRLYGHESCRGGRGLDLANFQVGSAAATVGLGLVATLVYAASVGTPLKSVARLKVKRVLDQLSGGCSSGTASFARRTETSIESGSHQSIRS